MEAVAVVWEDFPTGVRTNKDTIRPGGGSEVVGVVEDAAVVGIIIIEHQVEPLRLRPIHDRECLRIAPIFFYRWIDADD
jgi:hypothetical protein